MRSRHPQRIPVFPRSAAPRPGGADLPPPGPPRSHARATALGGRRPRFLALVGGMVLLSGAVISGGLAPAASAAPSTGAVLNEVFGGGGNSGATLRNDFIELANRGTGDLAVDGWSVQYISASPGATTTWQVTALTGSVPAGGRYLIGEAAGTGGTQDLPATQATGTINLSGTSGTVALVSATTALTCKTAADCAADPAIVDLVGYGTAVVREGGDAPALSSTTSAQRKDSADTDDNAADFTADAPTPGAANPGGGTPPPEPGPLRIHDLQGTGWLSPQDGKAVTNVPGVVTGVRTVGSKGYWIQDPTADADASTSEGIFVFTSAPGVAVGDSVLVSGTVKDFYPLGSGESVSTTSNLSITEITAPTVTVLAHDVALPAPVLVTPSTVPDVYAPDLGGGSIEATPVTPSRSALDFWETVEGMRVQVDDARVVGPSNSFGEQFVTTKPAQAASPRGGTVLTGPNAVPSGRVEVVPAAGGNPGVDVGDVFSGATVGPVDYSRFGGYLIAATQLGTVQDGSPAPVTATPQQARQLAVATYNVENLAPGDPDTKYQRLAQGVVTNLAAPDVLALEEVQDNNGTTNDTTVAADQTLAKLTAAIAAAGGPRYSWRSVDPVDDADGGAPGGNIRVVFLFNPARVSFVDAGTAQVNRSVTGTQVVKSRGKPALTLSPGRIDPTNPVWTTSRKPLVGQFTFRGKTVFVIADHFNSKGGDQSADGRFQYPAQTSAVQRAGQAQVVHDFVERILAVDGGADVVVLGDLNDYQFSASVNALRTGTADGTGPAILLDLISTLPPTQQYTYVFNGVSQVLDHILVTRHVEGVEYQVIHVNAEYADQVSDHDPQVVRLRP